MEHYKKRLYSYAFILALATIIYNLAEGYISIYFGYKDESFTLFGFGIDSIIEVVSGIGIAHMVTRTQFRPKSDVDRFEKTALYVTGTAFYMLVVSLVAMGVYHIVIRHQPETTFWGIVISTASILSMGLLIHLKMKVGKKLNSQAIVADAQCTKACMYMSIILLFTSLAYELLHIPYIDAIGMFGLAYFSFAEGKECFQKAKGIACCSSCK